MKRQLKDNRGVALSMVMILLSVMTVLGGVIYAYTMQSIKTLQYGTDRQKAEYLARSGIEASVFMYQDAMLQYDKSEEIRQFLDASHYDKDAQEDHPIVTNWVYLLADGKTFADGGSGDEPTPPNEDYIGYYRVTITNDEKEYEMPTGDGGTETKIEYIKRFKCVACCGDRAATRQAYIVPLVDITGKGWVSPQGVLQLDSSKSDETSIIAQDTISIDCGLIDRLVTAVADLFDPDRRYVNGRIKNQPLYVGATSGNMVIAKPKEADVIRFESGDKHDHITGLVSLSNLFVECGIDVEPDKKHFNSLILRGNEIVIDGEINMYVYDPGVNKPNSLLGVGPGIITKIAGNYRYSTVVLGTPAELGTTVTDPMPISAGGLGMCGKVYFGGDVYVNIITRNSTRKYKVFSAGDICYFDGDFQIGGKPYGVDLLKYFLDTSIAEGNYASTVLQQFERTREFYYPNATVQEVYSKYKRGNTPPSMRVIDLDKNKLYDTVAETVPPSSGDASYIIWE